MYIGIDQGTTSTRAILFDDSFRPVKIARRKFKQIYPKEGWVEHDAEEIWKTVVESVEEVLEGIDKKKVKAIGITNQRETVVAWDSKSGKVLYNAIVWQCRRTADRTEELKKTHGDFILERTGLVVDPYFSASKMEWMIENVDSVKEALKKGTLRFGTIDSFLAHKMAGKHVTDHTNASRTMLYNLKKLNWDEELLELFGIPEWSLPEIVDSAQNVGETIWGIPLSGMVGDQQGALFGQLAFEEGDMKITMGTGSFILMNIGNKPVFSKKGLLTTVGWKIGNEIVYALEGSVFITGALIDWLISIGLFSSPDEINRFAESSDNGGIYLVPALTGLGAPHWDPFARGLIIGITRKTDRGNLARAALESIAFSIKELVELMEEESEKKVRTLRVDGGVSKSDILLRILSKASSKVVERPRNMETTATGAVMLASIGIGEFSKEDLKKFREIEKSFEEFEGMEEDFKKWKEAVERSKGWAR